ncbi:MAG TPA: HAD-IIA family hydrolase [Candidatus Hydrogenedentes bacterium]|jgi:HAD superfamily hydrolase (TIGR01457 family)|nr:MAG: putative hydrolase YutF [Candidatus Hydrogenedentes bacterium ADurb.Bin170]HNZ49033.1 HAD-IIA family hydrolase [Candidatus Hydrogenedentota bacterium]HOD94634.1 HAD-IIA family hydrolase [Candidatus Hydrogenedentota bacterium]HOM49522.1 HAD-IIA family hydrolase [Candidatus Hydrogenedentota bacterium]HOR50082.1 HAD-IIA family hydrolase [Candidatus Hydrogenedentota bacterium]
MKPLGTVEGFLFDMDGTIYMGPHPIPGAAAFIAWLQENEVPFLFLTNNPTADKKRYRSKLAGMDIHVPEEQILTSGEATAVYLMTETPYRRIFALGTPSFENELVQAGLLLEERDPDAVVLSFDKTLTYAKLERAALLLQKGIPYIATNPDRVCPTEYGPIPDCGAMAALLESATGRSPKFIGKPEVSFARMAQKKLGTPMHATAMVGDRLYTDLEMARLAGMVGILVLSGETTHEDLREAAHAPDFTFESVRELHAAYQESRRL